MHYILLTSFSADWETPSPQSLDPGACIWSQWPHPQAAWVRPWSGTWPWRRATPLRPLGTPSHHTCPWRPGQERTRPRGQSGLWGRCHHPDWPRPLLPRREAGRSCPVGKSQEDGGWQWRSPRWACLCSGYLEMERWEKWLETIGQPIRFIQNAQLDYLR